MADDDVPAYPIIASQFNDSGVTLMFVNLCRLMRKKRGTGNGERGIEAAHRNWQPRLNTSLKSPRATVLIPGARVRYLSEIAEQGRAINKGIETQAEYASKAQQYYESLKELDDDKLPAPLDLYTTPPTSPPLLV